MVVVCVCRRGGGRGERSGVLPIMAFTRRFRSKEVAFRFQVYERARISPVEVYESVGK